jgi:hypothetical protein
MNISELERLIGKYYSGETSLEEEKILRDFFTGGNIPEGYEAEKEIFGFYSSEMKIPEPSADLETRIIMGLEKKDGWIDFIKSRRIILSAISAAAGLLILTGSYFFIIHRSESKDTYSDPQIAYASR